MRKITKRIAVIGTTTALAIGGGLAWAAWTATGGGSGGAQATSAQALVASPGTATNAVYPGGSSNVVFTVANPNPYAVNLTAVGGGAIAVDSGHAGCNLSSVSFTPQSVSVSVPANATAVPVTLTNALSMTPAGNDDCQGATFTVTLTLSGQSA